MADNDNTRPIRRFMDNPDIQWRGGLKPDYTKADELYLEGRSKRHAPDSIEEILSNIMKTFEMEAVHKSRIEDFGSIAPDFTMNVNGGRYFSAQDLLDQGTYNLLMNDSPLYDAMAETRDSSDRLFSGTFTKGFPWEVLEVKQGPPNVVFTWRHWAKMTGPFEGHEPTGELIEMQGCVVADVTTDLKLARVCFYHDANPMMAKLRGQCPFNHKTKE